MGSQSIVTFESEFVGSDVTKTLISKKISSMFLKFCQKVLHSICNSYPKFGVVALPAGSEKWSICTFFRNWKYYSVKFSTINKSYLLVPESKWMINKGNMG